MIKLDKKNIVWIGASIIGTVLLLIILNEYRVLQKPDLAQIAAENKMPNIYLYRTQVWIAAIGCIAVYSFLFKENPFYRAFEHALLGCATGYGCAMVTRQVLYEKMLVPIYTGFDVWNKTGMSLEVFSNVLLIIPAFIGMLWYFQYSKRYFWISRIAMCISLGAGSGLAFKGTFNQLIPQVTGTFKNLWPGDYVMPGASFWERAAEGGENLVFLIGTVSVLSYFFFAFGRKHFILKSSASLGRWYLMIALGAFFGNTFMTRLSALIERVHFLVAEWLHISQI
jgi:hypothetical protein